MKVKNKDPLAELLKRRPMTILVTEAQRQYLTQLCQVHGLPGTPLASMAATCFTRGLTVVGDEIGIPWMPPKV
jgi:hypothetical protein